VTLLFLIGRVPKNGLFTTFEFGVSALDFGDATLAGAGMAGEALYDTKKKPVREEHGM
jgi:hypothetical protein